ncbi:MAG: GGDEF domain-containing protein [Lachnospiraceae bacterium]
MHNRIADEKKYNTNMKFAKAVLNEDFVIMNAEEPLYDFLGRNSAFLFSQLLHPDFVDEFTRLCGSMQPEEEYRFVASMRDRDELYHPVDIHISISKPMEDGRQVYLLDIYVLDMIEKSHLDSQQKLDKYRTFMGIADLVYMEYWPETGRVVFYHYVVQKSYKLFEDNIENWHKAVLKYAVNKGNNITEIEQLYEKLKSLATQFSCVIKTGFLNQNHAPETLDISAKYISRHNMEVIVGVVKRKDVTDDDVPYYLTLAGKDAATGLLNKRALIEYTNDTLASTGTGKSYMVLIDIDNFKSINDTYGHLMGDKAILLLAETLVETLDGRGIVGRFGGDEFFVLTEDIPNETQLRLFLKALLSKLRLNESHKLGDLRFTLSMGISQYPEAGNSFKSMFALADKALYIAKDKGKNRYIIYRPELHDSVDVAGSHSEVSGSRTHVRTLRKTMKELFDNNPDRLTDVLEEVREGFGLGAIVVNYGNGADNVICTSGCGEKLKEISYADSESYMAVLVGDNMLVMNDLTTVLRIDGEIYDKLNATGCCSYIQVLFGSSSQGRCIVTYYVFGTKHKWSDNEKDFLEIIANAIYSAVKL